MNGSDAYDLDHLEELFEQALALSPRRREAFLDEHVGSNPELLAELRALLARADEDPDFLDRLGERVVGQRAREALLALEHDRLAEALRDRYRLRRRIGRGGMAAVYLADDLRHERSVAVKVLSSDLAAAVGAERFLAEIRTTANLQHPLILPLFDSGEAHGFLYYVMPYVEGESLRDRLDRERQLPVDDAVGIARDLADALDYAHRQGIVHRDLKPGNVLLHEGKPFLMDFGIALALEESDREARLTQTGHSVGTPLYMSPEQATGQETVGPPSDLYSLGCMLHEMLLGEPPHTGPTRQAILAGIMTEEVAPLTERRRSVPAHVDAAVRRALEKLPADRFQSARAFEEALRDPTFRHGGEARAGGPWRAWRSAVLAGSAGVLVMAVALAVGWWALGWGGGRDGAAGVAGSGVAGTEAARPSLAAPADADSRPSLAVLPLRDMSASGDQAYFGEGVAEEITNALNKIGGLRVIGVFSAFQLRDLPVTEVAERLAVGTVLTGSFRPEGDSVRVSARLIDGAAGFTLWSEQYDRAMESVIAIQEDIARQVVEALRVELLDDGPPLISAATDDHEAWELYVLGRHHWNRRSSDGFREAVAAFLDALARDPGFALAYSGLADAYVLLFEYSAMAPGEALPLARAAAERAMEIDPTLAEARASMAEVLAAERRWEAAEEHFRQALELNPGYITAHHWYGWLLTHLARHEEAIEYLRGAKALDPLSHIVRTDLGAAYYHARRFQESIDEAEACFESQLCNGMGRVYGRSLLAMGRPEDALASAREGGQPAVEVMALAALGREEEARRALGDYLGTPPLLDHPVTHLHLAEMYVALGDHEVALEAVERAEELGLATGPVLIREWPAFDPIRDLPRFRRVLEELGHPS